MQVVKCYSTSNNIVACDKQILEIVVCKDTFTELVIKVLAIPVAIEMTGAACVKLSNTF